MCIFFFFFQAEDGIRDIGVTGVQTCALPIFGVMRSREFIMKDAYSFDKDYEGLDITYNSMYEAYHNIFKRCGLDCKCVEADSGAIGGSSSAEFMVKSEIGEDEIAFCTECKYAANIEKIGRAHV